MFSRMMTVRSFILRRNREIALDDLKRRIRNIKERGVVMRPGESLEEMYAVRSGLYERYADITVAEEGKQIEETVSAVAEALRRGSYV